MPSKLEAMLAFQIRAFRLPEPERQFMFHPERKWRADFCWPVAKLIVEVGGLYRSSHAKGQTGHTTIGGVKRDWEKLNAAVMLGYRVLQYEHDGVKSGRAVREIEQALGMVNSK